MSREKLPTPLHGSTSGPAESPNSPEMPTRSHYEYKTCILLHTNAAKMTRIVSWNVKGLRSPQKRAMVLKHLRKLGADIAILQETHLKKEDFFRMKKFWVGEVVGSPAQGKKGGVLTLLKKTLDIQIDQIDSDDAGRRISIVIKKGKLLCRITNIYAPNSPTTAYFNELSSWMATNYHPNHYIGGDINSCVNTREDRSRTLPLESERNISLNTETHTPLSSFITAMHLTDFWRQNHPIDKEYTYYSPPHKTFSRIDYILGTTNTLNHIEDSDIKDILISDHAPITFRYKR